MNPPGDWAVACPKCGAPPGFACRSIRHPGGVAVSVYQAHKKRRIAWNLGGSSTHRPPSAKLLRFSRSSSRRGQLP
jgi:hypothetical protein